MILLGLLVLALGELATPRPAHAARVSRAPVLVDSRPSAGSVVGRSPRSVTLSFSEPVAGTSASVVVLDMRGRVVGGRVVGGTGQPPAGGGPPRSGATSMLVAPTASLLRGTYVVVWLASAPGASQPPVLSRGSFVFSVGAPGYTITPAAAPAEAAVVARAGAHPHPSQVVGILYWILRLVAFVAASILVGASAAAIAVSPSGWNVRRFRRAASLSWMGLTAATLLSIPVQGAYASSLGPLRILDPSLLWADLSTHFGRVELAQLLLLVLAAVLLDALPRSEEARVERAPRWWPTAAAAVGAGILVTITIAGHSVQGRWVVFGTVIGVVHMAGAALWVGGLLVVFQIVTSGRDDRRRQVAELVRVSDVLVVAVVVVVASGVLQALRQVGSAGGLVTTAYGRLLLAKTVLVCVLIGLGLQGRRLVRGRIVGRAQGPGSPRWTSLRGLVVVESVLVLGVLGVTASLVNTPPAAQQLLVPVSETFPVGGHEATVVVAPGRAGPGNQFHVFVGDDRGRPASVAGVGVTMYLPSGRVGPIAVPAFSDGTGHFVAPRLIIPTAGRWRVTLVVSSSETSTVVATSAIVIS